METYLKKFNRNNDIQRRKILTLVYQGQRCAGKKSGVTKLPVEEKQCHLLGKWTELFNHNVPIADNRKDIKYLKRE